VLLTDVKAVFRNFGAPNAEAIVSAGVEWFDTQRFAAGSMAPKVEAAIRFARATGGTAAIGALDDAAALIAGTSGTLVLPGEAAVRVRPVGAG
jgi:carbamate kinase